MTANGGKQRVWPWTAGAIALVASVFGIVTFLTGNNLPDFINPPAAPVEGSDEALVPDGETLPTYRTIQFPEAVFGFERMDNPMRQSYLLTASDAEASAYAYSYWQDPASVWMDATAAAGGRTSELVAELTATASAAGQRTVTEGPMTCVWDQDSDPNTPMHTVKCFRIDTADNRGLVVWTETQSVGDPNGLRLTEELWNLMTWG